MRPTTFAFAISAFLACAGTCIVLGAVASVQQLCTEAPNGYYPTNLGGDVTCSAFMSLYWVTWALQVFFLLCVSLSAATQSIHTYKSTLAAQGAVAVALGVTQCGSIYMYLMRVPHSAPAYHRAWAYLVGQAIALSGTLLMLFTGDAMYRAHRVEGRDGFVTFRRVPANWQAKLEQEEGAAAASVTNNSGPAAWAFWASLLVAVAGTCVDKWAHLAHKLPRPCIT